MGDEYRAPLGAGPDASDRVAAPSFTPTPGQHLTPSGARARYDANVAAIRTLRTLDEKQRTATAEEQRMLAGWSSWGALPEVFDEAKTDWAAQRAELRVLLSDAEYLQARRTTLNAHYTDSAYVAAIWHAVTQLGFAGGRVLEPGCGSGTFLGLAPVTAELTGVELDTTTARIARALYPDAEVRAESFVDTRFSTGWFDLTVGNVPFADVALHDPVDNPNGHSIHNHFILKALRLTRPGGIVAVLTSHYTMDAGNPGARREMTGLADLVGAVRLPSGAHRRTAGTEAVTDLLILRRRDPGTSPADTKWDSVALREIDGTRVKVNAYFEAHPDHILGTLTVRHGMYGAETLHVTSDDLTHVATQLRDTLDEIVHDAAEQGMLLTPRTPEQVVEAGPALPMHEAWDGSIRASDDGTFQTMTADGPKSLAVPKSASSELRHLLKLRDAAAEQLALERATLDDTAEITAARGRLRDLWERYVTSYGPINRYTPTATGRTDPDTGEPVLARRTPTAPRLLRDDPFGPLVFALEIFDDDTQEATAAALLHRRVITPKTVKLGADTAVEAVQLSLDRDGRVDLPYIAGLLGEELTAARALLGRLVFDDPVTGELIHAPAYLSGSIRPQLDAARAAAASDPRFQINVEALEAALPDPLTPEEITARIGAVWISPSIHEQFLRELLNDRHLTVTNPLPAEWQVRGTMRFTVRASQEWGTERRPAPDLFEALASQSPIRVDDTYKDADGRQRSVFNPTETAAAQDKAQLLQERFEAWVWEDPERARALADEYNRRFNSIVLRDYTADGDYLTLPGMSDTFELRQHQRAAVARMIAEPAVGLFHEVGAGKTAEMVTGAMELKRMGMVSKVGVIVPNHMLEQFTREWLQIYPQARILAANTDTLTGDKRRVFVARAAANDWDAVILTRTAFQRLSMEPANQAAYMDHTIALLRDALDVAAGVDRMTLKRIEKRLANEEERYKRLLDMPRDPGVTFEATGIDYLIVDEMHDYKNLNTVSKIPDANIDGSMRATDMALKLDYLRRIHPHRVATVATATPIANSVTEAHVMQRYLRPDLLRDAGVEAFDAWAATFGETVTDVEMAPQGGGQFRVKTRFARFRNVPEMLRLWHTFADVKTAADLDLPAPLIHKRGDGQRLPETVVIDPNEAVLEYIRDLGDRADAVASRLVTPDVDNMLTISTDGRKAALDIRMVHPNADPIPAPLDDVADNIARLHHAHADNRYTDTRTGDPSPIPGALQLVFCDLGTPNPNRWNAYDELRALLVDRGVPNSGIRYIHEAKNDKEKARLFAAARDGKIAVLIGSTSRMGVGTNVQTRAIALHDIDCPWRPADVAQRHGRILRQGNQNAEVGIYQYVVQNTFAAYMWQAIERKSKFIGQVMRGRLDVREIDDLGNDSLSAAEAKALASGNPLLLERSVALNEVARLERLERAWRRNQGTLRATIDNATRQRHQADTDLAQLAAAIPRLVDLSGDNFRMVVADRAYGARKDAADAIAFWCRGRSLHYARPIVDDRAHGQLGTISDFCIHAATRSDLGRVYLHLDLEGIPGGTVRTPVDKALTGDLGLIRMLEHRLSSIDQLTARTQQARADAEMTLADAHRSLDAPFKHTDALTQTRARLAHLDEQLSGLAHQPMADTATVSTQAGERPDRAAPFTLPATATGRGLSR